MRQSPLQQLVGSNVPKKRRVIIWEPCICSDDSHDGCRGTMRRARTEQRFLCIGGPNDGKYLNETALGPKSQYHSYIRHSGQNNHKKIWVWTGYFQKITP